MELRVISNRLDWPAGTIINRDDIGGNVDALILGGHLQEVKTVQATQSQPQNDEHGEYHNA